MKKYLVLLAATLLTFTAARATPPFANLDSYKGTLGFTRFYSEQHQGRALKIALLHSNFSGHQAELGKTLPSSTRFISAPKTSPQQGDSLSNNGTRIAQLLIAMMTDDMRATQWMPELTLYEVSTSTQLKNAVDHLMTQKVDLVLSAQVWDGGGNFDGTGTVNHQVDRATREGIIWVSMTGDFARTTFNSGIQTGYDNWLRLPDQNNGLMIRCEHNKSGKCKAHIALTWNDFKNDINAGTDKDLDLVLTDDLLNILKTSTQKQTTNPNETRPGYTKSPTEIIAAELTPGMYFLRVKNRSQNFVARDQLRLVVDGDFITMPSHSVGESLLNPADHRSVITVGANDNDESSFSFSLGKPDLVAPSYIVLPNGEQAGGSDHATAIVAAGLGLLKSQSPQLTREALLNLVRNSTGNWDQGGLSLNLLGFRPTGPGCFWDVVLNPLPPYLHEIISKGGVLVETTAAIRVMVPFDPILSAHYLRRQRLNDMIVALPQGGYAVYPRYASIPNGAAEIFQRPLEAGLCRPRPGGNEKNFRL